MKLSKKKTEWILVRANCTNEYSDVDCCLIHMIEGIPDIWKERWYQVKRLGEDTDSLCGVEWLYNDMHWLSLDMEEVTGDEDADWCYVSLGKGELDKVVKLNGLNEKVNATSMHINPAGTIWMEGWGKHSGDQYTTNDIEIEKL